MKEWGLDIGSDFEAAASEDIAKHRDRVVTYILSRIILYSPVDTGAFRGNHRVSVGEEDHGSDKENFDTGPGTMSAGLGALTGAAPFTTVYIQNNLPYAERLEDGWSKQNTRGIYSLALNDAKEKFS